ncbi:hypothetical protein O3885_09390 [Fusobacterium sp. 27098_8_59]|uniref:hypothetical protein n=1 Tax=Fusobacterium sp. 27098_8_59 TaxID=3003691 RepID=UPI00352EF4A3
MWKCKKCSCNRFYQTFRGILSIEKADKNQEIIKSRDDILKYSKFYCEECKKSGWTLDEVAKWEEDMNE